MAGSGSYARGDQPRSVPDALAGPYEKMAAQQRAYNARQAAELEPRAGGARRSVSTAPALRAAATSPLAERMYRPPADDIAELRRQQAEFKKTERAISRENAWMAGVALAPVGVVAGLGIGGAIATRLAPAVVTRGPLQFLAREPYRRVGDNWATRAGRRAHQQLKERLESKGGGWEYEPKVPRVGQKPLKPDGGTPQRNPADPTERFYLELKPNTPTGRAAGARAVKRYRDASEQKARTIYYDPKDFI